MFRRLLVPIDGPIRAATIAHAASLARAFGASLTLLGIKETAPDQGGQPIDPFEWHVELSRILARLDGEAAKLRDTGLEVRTAVREGPASERVPEYADRDGADLIVLTRGWRGPVEGSPLRAVLHGGRHSILVVPSEGVGLDPARGHERILFPLDGSAQAECVLPIAHALHVGSDARCLLAHVVQEPRLPGSAAPTGDDVRLARSMVERNRHAATASLNAARERFAEGAETRVIVSGNVLGALHDLVATESPDLIVLSAHGAAGDPRWGCGSVATHLIEYAERPVLIVQDHRVPVALSPRMIPVRV